MPLILQPEDLAPFATIPADKADALIRGAEAVALLIAPGLANLEADTPQHDAAKDILREAVLRRNEAGSGAVESVASGPFNVSLSTRRSMFTLVEEKQLEKLGGATASKAFSRDMTPVDEPLAPDWWSPWP